MNKLINILGISIAFLSLPLSSCSKLQEPTKVPIDPTPSRREPPRDIPKEKEKTNETKLTADLIALQNLRLKPLELDSESLPPLPTPADPTNNSGLDDLYNRREEKAIEMYKKNPNNRLVGNDEGWRIVSTYIIWAYGKPKSITLGDNTLDPVDTSRDYDSPPELWRGKPSIPITLNCRNSDYITTYYNTTDPVKLYRFDSLRRLHGVVRGNLALHKSTPMPYDLRHMRIAHEGVDISPLFSIRYKDYKEVVRTRKYNKWYWRDVRVSDVGMDVLDWLFDGYFEIYPLTKDYPRFTVIFILKDGTVISREVEHRV